MSTVVNQPNVTDNSLLPLGLADTHKAGPSLPFGNINLERDREQALIQTRRQKAQPFKANDPPLLAFSSFSNLLKAAFLVLVFTAPAWVPAL